jgi:hypothetical protein
MLPSARVIQVDTRGAVILQEESPQVCFMQDPRDSKEHLKRVLSADQG